MLHTRIARFDVIATVALFGNLVFELSPCLVGLQNPKKCYSTCHIECLRFMHGALNVDEKKTNCTIWWEITRRTF